MRPDQCAFIYEECEDPNDGQFDSPNFLPDFTADSVEECAFFPYWQLQNGFGNFCFEPPQLPVRKERQIRKEVGGLSVPFNHNPGLYTPTYHANPSAEPVAASNTPHEHPQQPVLHTLQPQQPPQPQFAVPYPPNFPAVPWEQQEIPTIIDPEREELRARLVHNLEHLGQRMAAPYELVDWPKFELTITGKQAIQEVFVEVREPQRPLPPKDGPRQRYQRFREKAFVCDECEHWFTLKQNVQMHIFHYHMGPNKVEPKRGKRYKCNKCDMMFKSMNQAEKHDRRVHREKVRQMFFRCEQCPKIYQTSSQLREHFSIMHLNERPFKCDQCEAVFGRRGGLRRHVTMVHTGHLFKCPVEGCDHPGYKCSKVNCLQRMSAKANASASAEQTPARKRPSNKKSTETKPEPTEDSASTVNPDQNNNSSEGTEQDAQKPSEEQVEEQQGPTASGEVEPDRTAPEQKTDNKKKDVGAEVKKTSSTSSSKKKSKPAGAKPEKPTNLKPEKRAKESKNKKNKKENINSTTRPLLTKRELVESCQEQGQVQPDLQLQQLLAQTLAACKQQQQKKLDVRAKQPTPALQKSEEPKKSRSARKKLVPVVNLCPVQPKRIKLELQAAAAASERPGTSASSSSASLKPSTSTQNQQQALPHSTKSSFLEQQVRKLKEKAAAEQQAQPAPHKFSHMFYKA